MRGGWGMTASFCVTERLIKLLIINVYIYYVFFYSLATRTIFGYSPMVTPPYYI